MRRGAYGAEGAVPRPWRIEWITRQGHAVVKGADGSIVCVCHADNAAAIVAAVNSTSGAGAPKEPQTNTISRPKPGDGLLTMNPEGRVSGGDRATFAEDDK